jgi:hypothetical protein
MKERFSKSLCQITLLISTYKTSQDNVSQAIANIKEAEFFAIHMDKSIDIIEKTQFLTFNCFSFFGQFVSCKPFPETTKCQGILDVRAVISVLTIRHINNASASAQTVLPPCLEA